MTRGPTIIDKLTAFSQVVPRKNNCWFTRKQLANIVGCEESSIGAAFTWLRGNNFIITSFWVRKERRYLYNVKRGDTDSLSQQAKRTKKDLSVFRQELRASLKGA